MPKLNRSAYRTYIDAVPSGQTPTWFLIGKDVEDMSVDMNAQVETRKNILDETSVNHTGYEPSFAVDTYFANPEDSIYDLLQDISMNRLKGDACKTKVLEVIVEDTDDTSHAAWQEDVIIEVQSYGGSQEGFAIPYTVHFDGNRTAGTVAYTGGVPTFTPTT